MTDPVSLITAALQADAEVVRVLGQNIANASTAGYRRAVPTATPTFPQALSDITAATEGADSATSVPRLLDALAALTPHTQSVTDFSAGTLESTAGALDLAIEGPGFFVVAAPAGDELTRRGDFRIDADGRLATQQGDLVLGQGGPIAVPPGRFAVARDGTVTIDGAAVDRLRIVEVGSDVRLEATGRGTYTAPAGTTLRDDGASAVRQGFIESSNVAPVNEMIRLMEAMRHFETAQRFARGYDDMLSLAISELGRI